MSVVFHKNTSKLAYPLFFGATALVKPLFVSFPLHDSALNALKYLNKFCEALPVPKNIVCKKITLAGCPTELLSPLGPMKSTDSAILYLHGGAFLLGGPGTHRLIAAEIANKTRTPVYVLNYNQLPETGIGGSVHDAVAAYRELSEDLGYRRIALMGDSAGGFLSGKVIEAVAKQKLVKPVCFVGFSPLIDLDAAIKPGRTSVHDAYIPASKMRKLSAKWDNGPVEFTGVRDISELPPEIFPPTFLVTATSELLEPDSIKLQRVLSAAGKSIQLHSYNWMVHAFPVAVMLPHSVDVLARATEFVVNELNSKSFHDGVVAS